MADIDSIEEILEFAIAREKEAEAFYRVLAGRVSNPAMAELLLEFAKEEVEHRAKLELEMLKLGQIVPAEKEEVDSERIFELMSEDYLPQDQSWVDMSYEDLLVLGMRKERASFRLYVGLAAIIQDEQLQDVLLSLAEEEAKHKLKLELDYDEVILKKK
jgi:rubrerythrin